jgi:hypothetical protein
MSDDEEMYDDEEDMDDAETCILEASNWVKDWVIGKESDKFKGWWINVRFLSWLFNSFWIGITAATTRDCCCCGAVVCCDSKIAEEEGA